MQALWYAKDDAVIAPYASQQDRPDIPFWPMLFENVTIRLLGSDDFPAAAKQQAATDLTSAAAEGALTIPIDTPMVFAEATWAHDRHPRTDSLGDPRLTQDPPDDLVRELVTGRKVWR